MMELWPGGPLFQPAAHAPLSTDSVLLADFVNTAGARRGVDLGCASGILMLLLLQRSPALHMAGLELVAEAAEAARENMERNGLAGRSRILLGDIRDHRALFAAGSFDLAVANPPYYPPGSGSLPADRDRAAARGETDCTLEQLCEAAAFLLRTGGRFVLCHKPERLSELLCTMSRVGLEPKRLRLCCDRAGSAPNLVLAEGRRGAHAGLQLLPCLVLRQTDGSETEEVRRIYHREESPAPGSLR